MRKASAFISLVVLISSITCIMPTSDVVVSPTADFSAIIRVAVWRFRDGGKIANSGDISTTAIESAFMERRFGVISYSMIKEILSVEIGYREGMAFDSGMLTPRVLSRIYDETGAEAIIIGAVSESWCDIGWLPPCRLAASFKMISTASGELIVSASASDEGHSAESAALKMARKAVGKIR